MDPSSVSANLSGAQFGGASATAGDSVNSADPSSGGATSGASSAPSFGGTSPVQPYSYGGGIE